MSESDANATATVEQEIRQEETPVVEPEAEGDVDQVRMTLAAQTCF